MDLNNEALNRLPESVREPLRRYAGLIDELCGTTAKALAVFGVVVSGPFDIRHQTVRNVLIVERIDLRVLRRLAEHGAKLGKAGIAAPLTMMPKYIQSSLDTFPLELLEIMQHHRMLFGDDPFDDLSFEEGHIRLQCERELKVVLIGMRQGLLAAAGREKVIGALESDVGEGIVRTLRGMGWLKGTREAQSTEQIVTEVEKHCDRKLTGIRTALDRSAHHGWDEFESLYRDVEALGEIVNGW